MTTESAPGEAAPEGRAAWRDRLRGRWEAGAGGRRWADLAAPLVLLALSWLYAGQLAGSRMLSDDEGSYLYAAWRISLGQRPYCDFLTPQLPGFLLPGGLLFRLTGPDFVAARWLSVGATLGAVVLLWWATRRLFGPAVALVAATLLALHPDVFLAGRVFRADGLMLFFAVLGLALFARGVLPRPEAIAPPVRRWLLAAGLVFGLATVTKLFGPLVLGGCLLWLALDAWRRRRPWRPLAADGAALLLPCLAVVALGLGWFVAAGCDVYGAILRHHTMQGAALAPGQVLAEGIDFYVTYLRYNENALLYFVALVAAVAAWRWRDRRALVFALLLPMALALLALSRELFARHLNYVVPAAATLFALAMAWLAQALERSDAVLRRGLPVALVAALVFVWWQTDRDMAWQQEDGTERLADFIQLTTAPGDWVLADNSEIDFWGRRVTTFSAASLSAGAAQSGQITWDRIQGELDAAGAEPAQVWVDRTNVAGVEYGQLRFLHDLDRFEAWLEAGYDFAGPFQRAIQHLQVYTPKGRPLPVAARFTGGPTLLAGGSLEAEVAQGGTVDLRSAWRAADGAMPELVATVRLVDGRGMEWAQGDDGLMASPYRTTDRWLPGELTSHRFALTVPPGTPPGRYTLRLGLYRRDTGQPLPATDPTGAGLGTSVPIGSLQVSAGRAVAAARLPLAERVGASSAAGLSLLGRGALPSRPVSAGSVVPLDLWWDARDVTGDLSARVTLSDPAVGSVAADTVVPLGVPGTPSGDWPAGPLTVRQQARLPVLADAAGGTYTVGVIVVDAAGQPAPGASSVALGELMVMARDLGAVVTVRPAVSRTLTAALGEVAELAGVDLPDRSAPGADVPVRLVWRARTASALPYRVTVQLLDASDHPVAQHDGEPASEARPTTGWLPGEYVTDLHHLALPADLPPGRYRVIAALYDPATLVRLAASGPDVTGDAVLLGELEVGGGPPLP